MPLKYLWRKHASDAWLCANETDLLARFAERVALIERPERKRTTVEICCATRRDALELAKDFGGSFRRSPQTTSSARSKPLKIASRLVIVDKRRRSQLAGRRQLVIPASGAFGTGEHATTAMCLRMLERATRGWRNDWSMLDAGTGTGILALAAKCFGAKSVIGIDNDPRAIAIAKDNARSNQIDGIRFMIGDATKLKLNGKLDLIAANLFSELLIKAIPKWQSQLKTTGILIMSGILRSQERDVIRALRRQGASIKEIRRRGKWVALVAGERKP